MFVICQRSSSWCVHTAVSSVLFNLNSLLSLLHPPPLSPSPPFCMFPLSPGQPSRSSPTTSTNCGSPESLGSLPCSQTTPRTFPGAQQLWEEFGTDGGPATIDGDVRALQLIGRRCCEPKQQEEVTLAGLGTFLRGCQQLKDEFCVIETTIPIQLARFLIGMRGSQVKRIQVITGATINLSRSLDPSPAPNSRKLQITGSLPSVYAALALSQSLLINRSPPMAMEELLLLPTPPSSGKSSWRVGKHEKLEKNRWRTTRGQSSSSCEEEEPFLMSGNKLRQQPFVGLEFGNYMAAMARDNNNSTDSSSKSRP
eukprot:GHVS01041991.1.p1 GENE.GHVS01041991.1~~GHVS01041991.1.p1  ORF type:complete len:311 (-),score=60.06 GHVS01041991.1:379-1311(-)